jgi:hypothetical protein
VAKRKVAAGKKKSNLDIMHISATNNDQKANTCATLFFIIPHNFDQDVDDDTIFFPSSILIAALMKI